MKEIKWKRVIKTSLLLLLYITKINFKLFAQSEEELPKQTIYNEEESANYWVPTLLKSSASPVNTIAQFNGFVFNWSPRGQPHRSTLIDGINWASNLSGWNSAFSYKALYKAFKKTGSTENYEFNESTYEVDGYINNMNSSPRLFKKGIGLGASISNNANFSEFRFEYSSGKLKHNWWTHSILAFQETPNGILPQGFKKLNGVALSAEKVFSKNRSLNLLFWWNQASQGKSAPSVKEAIELAGERFYNPSWGWLNGQAYFPNSKHNSSPTFSLLFKKKYNEKVSTHFSLGVAFGNQSTSQLDWNKTADPRPDYYRYLPSYVKDSATQQELIEWYQINPQALQINFNQMEKINQGSPSKRAYYIINNQVAQVLLFRASFQFNAQWNNYWSWNTGVGFSRDQIHHTNVLENLLGGQYYYNYNGWINDDGVSNNFQNDIQEPNRKVKVGDTWGDNYILSSIRMIEWLQIKKESAKWEFSIGLNNTQEYFNRDGLNQNGLFPNTSIGISPILTFPGFGVKGQLLYKISGRFYSRAIIFSQQVAPSSQAIYINPSILPAASPYLLPILNKGIDITLFYRGVNTKLTASYFLNNEYNDSEKRMFYHDKYSSFVYGVVGQLQKQFHGLEASIETTLFGKIQLSAASTIGKYRFTSNPIYQIMLVNDLYKVESGTLHLTNLPASNSPEIVNAFSVQCQPTYLFRIGVTAVGAARRSISYDYFRRSFLFLSSFTNNAIREQIQHSYFLPDQWTTNAYLTKSFNFKSKQNSYLLICNLSWRNLFNQLIPVLAFEQSRFDYVGLNINKFPLKFLYDQGVVYSLSLQFQIQ